MITLELIAEGLENGDICIVDSPHEDGVVCRISDHWFYFGGQTAEEMSAAEYLENIPRKDISKEIFEVLEDFCQDPGFADEYRYYEAVLNERANARSHVAQEIGFDRMFNGGQAAAKGLIQPEESFLCGERHSLTRTAPAERRKPKPPQR